MVTALRIYEHYGTPEEVKRWKEVYDKLLDVLNTEEFMKYFKDTSNTHFIHKKEGKTCF